MTLYALMLIAVNVSAVYARGDGIAVAAALLSTAVGFALGQTKSVRK